jgi:hypothetical protein
LGFLIGPYQAGSNNVIGRVTVQLTAYKGRALYADVEEQQITVVVE